MTRRLPAIVTLAAWLWVRAARLTECAVWWLTTGPRRREDWDDTGKDGGK